MNPTNLAKAAVPAPVKEMASGVTEMKETFTDPLGLKKKDKDESEDGDETDADAGAEKPAATAPRGCRTCAGRPGTRDARCAVAVAPADVSYDRAYHRLMSFGVAKACDAAARKGGSMRTGCLRWWPRRHSAHSSPPRRSPPAAPDGGGGSAHRHGKAAVGDPTDFSSNWSGYVATALGSTLIYAGHDDRLQERDGDVEAAGGGVLGEQPRVGVRGLGRARRLQREFSTAIEQTGTSADCSLDGKPTYYAW